MASILKPKRRSTDATAPTTENLADGEVAINAVTKTIYQRIGEAVVAVANYFTDAPSDGKSYVRKDGTWVEAAGGGGSSDAPVVISTNTTLSSSHIEKIIEWTGATGTLTLPTGIGQHGSMISFVNNSEYNLTVARDTDVSLYRYATNANIVIPARRVLSIFLSSVSDVWYST